MNKLLVTLGLLVAFSTGLVGCADDIDARGAKVDTDTNMDNDEGTAGMSGSTDQGGEDDDADSCAAACDDDECVAACND